MKEVRIGLIGTGYIGKAHALAYAQAPTVFNLRGRLVREMVAEVTPELAAARAQAFGFNRSTGDWRALVADPAIDVAAANVILCRISTKAVGALTLRRKNVENFCITPPTLGE